MPPVRAAATRLCSLAAVSIFHSMGRKGQKAADGTSRFRKLVCVTEMLADQNKLGSNLVWRVSR
jgi:hypothetical protein